MDARLPFIFPISGLKLGIHEFKRPVKDDFFDTFETSFVKKGQIDVQLFLDIRENMVVVTFSFDGTIQTECDRCAEDFDLPIRKDDVLTIKYTHGEKEEEADILYIPHGTAEIDLSTYVYEYIVLAVPMVKYHEDADENCPQEILDLLDFQEDTSNDEDDDNDEKGSSPWDALNDLKLN